MHPDLDGVEADCRPRWTPHRPFARARAVLIGTTENFGYMSGLVKDFFERIYYSCEGELQGLPYAVYIAPGETARARFAVCRAFARAWGGTRFRRRCCCTAPGDSFATRWRQLGHDAGGRCVRSASN